jgi:hypothetical protein
MDREAAGRNEAPAFGQSGLRMSAANNQRPRMLILEDDSVMLCMVGDYFEQHDMRAVSAMCTDRFVFTRRTVRNGSRAVKVAGSICSPDCPR